MRTALIVGVLCVAALLIGGTCWRQHQLEDYRAGISAVLARRVELRSQFLSAGHRPMTKAYVEALKEVDTSACPPRFKLAWLGYVHAWERRTDSTEAIYGVTSFAEGFTEGDFKPLLHEMDKLNTNEAWYVCQQIAVLYGVNTNETN